LCHVNVRDLPTGTVSAGWVLEFVERLKYEPWSHFRAHLIEEAPPAAKPPDGEDWRAWLGWGPTEDKLTEGFDLLAIKGADPSRARRFKGTYRPGRAPRLIARTIAELRNTAFVQQFRHRMEGEPDGVEGGRSGRGPGDAGHEGLPP
jgi:hypothetical protein